MDLSHYSIHFESLPKERNPQNVSSYVSDWAYISTAYRQKVNFRCEICTVDLLLHIHLLDVHHINGVKADNSETNLKALCKICHKEQPKHQQMCVDSAEIQQIKLLRVAQSEDLI